MSATAPIALSFLRSMSRMNSCMLLDILFLGLFNVRRAACMYSTMMMEDVI